MDQLPDIYPFKRRLEELAANMAEPSFYSNPRKAADITREHQKLGKMVEEHEAFLKLEIEEAEAKSLSKDPSADTEMRELALAELPQIESRRLSLKQSVLLSMIPPEATDSRNTVMEIRAGTGGEEAALLQQNSPVATSAIPMTKAGKSSL